MKKNSGFVITRLFFFFSSMMFLSACFPFDTAKREYFKGEEPLFSVCRSSEESAFELVGNQSVARIKVYSSGRLASLGHNHIVKTGSFSGQICLNHKLENSTAQLVFSVSDMIIDDQNDRLNAGESFSKPISYKQIMATRNNLLGENLLNANRYPKVKLAITNLKVEHETMSLDVSVNLLGIESIHRIPVLLKLSENAIEVSGQTKLNQTALGLKPFQLFAGALAVADGMDIEFYFRAKKTDS